MPRYCTCTTNELARAISVLIAYAQYSPLKAHADEYSEFRGLNFDRSLYFVYSLCIACADPDSYFRGGPTLRTFFLVNEWI